MRIWREYGFEAAHWLPNVPEGHKCGRMHGHSYRVEIHIAGSLDDDGWVCDFSTIDVAWSPAFETLDHRCLNDVPGLENPTSENVARYIWHQMCLAGLSSVGQGYCLAKIVVRETIRSGCEYEGT